MVDIHTHLLPGVDDGAENLEEACLMAQSAWNAGTRAVVLTPHTNVPDSFQNFWDEGMLRRFTALREALVKLKNPITILMGEEVFGTDDVADKLASGQVLTLNNSRYVLMEFWTNDQPARVRRVLDSVRSRGYVPVIAHPERYRFVQENPAIAEEWAGMGDKFQLNKGSVMGSFGQRVAGTAHRLLSERLAHVIASDGHSPYQRTLALDGVYEYVSERYSRNYADALLINNPTAITQNQ